MSHISEYIVWKALSELNACEAVALADVVNNNPRYAAAAELLASREDHKPSKQLRAEAAARAEASRKAND